MFKKYLIAVLFILILIAGAVPIAKALKNSSGEVIHLSPNEVINENYYVAAKTLTIDGKIEGDLYCAAEKVIINGEIDGSVLCFASEMEINGTVQDNVRIAAETINLNGFIGKNLQCAVNQLKINENAQVGRDAQFAAALADVNGQVGRDIDAALNKLSLSADVGRNVNLRLSSDEENSGDSLLISDASDIGGSLNYKASKQGKIEDEGKIAGGVNYTQFIKERDESSASGVFNFLSFWSFTVSVLAAMVLGFILIAVWPKQFKGALLKTNSNNIRTIIAGFVGLFAVPLAAIIAICTLIGLPLGIIVFVLWGVSIYLAKIIFSMYIGEKILPYVYKEKKDSLVWIVFVGILAVWILAIIPVLGLFVKVCATIFGMGMIWNLIEMSIGKEIGKEKEVSSVENSV